MAETKQKAYEVVKETRRVLPNDTVKSLQAQLKALQADKNLSADVKSAAVKGIESAIDDAKPFALTVAKSTKPGRMDLVEVSGPIKSKMLSPNLLRGIGSPQVVEYLDTVFAEFDS